MFYSKYEHVSCAFYAIKPNERVALLMWKLRLTHYALRLYKLKQCLAQNPWLSALHFAADALQYPGDAFFYSRVSFPHIFVHCKGEYSCCYVLRAVGWYCCCGLCFHSPFRHPLFQIFMCGYTFLNKTIRLLVTCCAKSFCGVTTDDFSSFGMCVCV